MNYKNITLIIALVCTSIGHLYSQCANINAPTNMCNGRMETLSATINSGDNITYLWSVSDNINNEKATLSDPTSPTPTITYNTEGLITINLTVAGTNLEGCNPSTSRQVIVGTSVFYEINNDTDDGIPNNDTDFDYTLCSGISVNLESLLSGNGGVTSLEWSQEPVGSNGGSVILSSTTDQNITVTTENPGLVDVTLTYTDGIGCVGSYTETFTIYEDVTTSIDNPNNGISICSSSSLQLLGNATGGGDNYINSWQLTPNSTNPTRDIATILDNPSAQQPTFTPPSDVINGEVFAFTYTADPTDTHCGGDVSAEYQVTVELADASATLQSDDDDGVLCTDTESINLSIQILDDNGLTSNQMYNVVIGRSDGADINVNNYSSGDDIPITPANESTYTLRSAISTLGCTPSSVTGAFTFTYDDTPPTISNCRDDRNLDLNNNCSLIIPDYTAAGGILGEPAMTFDDSEDCEVNVVQNPAAGTIIENVMHGQTFPISITATDQNNNSADCNFTITANDEVRPTIATCVADQDIAAENADGCFAIIPDFTGDIVANDNCGVTSIAQAPIAGSTFGDAVGDRQTITFTVTDFAGNSRTCEAELTIIDIHAPVWVDKPTNIDVNPATDITGNPLCSGRVPNMSDFFTAEDNCDNSVAITQSPASGTSFGSQHGDEIQVAVTASDGRNTSDNITAMVTVRLVDNVFPEISCGDDREVSANPITCSGNVNVPGPSFSDNCNFVSINHDSDFGSSPTNASGPYPAGVTVITWTATDAAGNQTTCQQTITVADNVAPEIICSDVELSTGDNCNARYTDNTTIIEDACGNVTSITYELTGATTGSGNGTLNNVTFNQGRTTVTYTAADDVGNSGSCSFIVDVTDETAPVFTTAPTDRNFSTNDNNCSGTVPDLISESEVSDNCSSTEDIVVTQNPSAETTFTAEDSPLSVVLTAIDDSGNTQMITVTLTLVDDDAPSITCADDINVDALAGECAANVTVPTPTVDDNCGVAMVTNNYNNGGADASGNYPVGSTTVTYTVTDLSGNINTCSIVINVADNTPPIVNCGNDLTVTTLPDQCAANFSDVMTIFTDNCPDVTVSYTYENGGMLEQARNGDGTGLVTDLILDFFESPTPTTTPNVYAIDYVINDGNGNIILCSFDVTVEDNTGPVISGPANQEVAAGNNCEGTVPDLLALTKPNSSDPLYTASDNCNNASTITQTPAPGTTFSGSIGVELKSIDDNSNEGVLIVNVFATDTEAPSITCPTNVAQSYDTEIGNCTASVNLNLATATDNCSVTITNDFNDGGADAGGDYPVGTTIVTFTATDAAGTTTTCPITIEVHDNQNPTISTCPNDRDIPREAGTCNQGIIPDLTSEVVANDNCNGNLTITQQPNPGTTFNGSQTVTITVSDGNNSTQCTTELTVLDEEAPVFTDCNSANFIVTFNSNDPKTRSCEVTIPDFRSEVNVMDNCPNSINITQSPIPGSTVNIADGDVTITLTATDGGGNMATCSNTMRVMDNNKPFLRSIPQNLRVSTTGTTTPVSWVTPTYLDYCDNQLFVFVSATNNVSIDSNGATDSGEFPIGLTTVTYVAIDAGGNTETGRFNIIVE